MLDERLSVPLYIQLKQLMLKKIESGEWCNSEKIPSEMELCKQYGISRMTVRLAIYELKNEGYMYRKQGKGTFVTIPKIEQKLGSFYSFSDDITKMGYSVKSDVLSFRTMVCPQVVAGKLSVQHGTKVYEIKRLRYVNELPFAFETSYIPNEICPGLTRKSVLNNGLYNTIHKISDIKPDVATEAFEAVVIGKQPAEQLKLRRNTPGFHIMRVTSSKGRVFEFCESYVRGDILTYNVILK